MWKESYLLFLQSSNSLFRLFISFSFSIKVFNSLDMSCLFESIISFCDFELQPAKKLDSKIAIKNKINCFIVSFYMGILKKIKSEKSLFIFEEYYSPKDFNVSKVKAPWFNLLSFWYAFTAAFVSGP